MLIKDFNKKIDCRRESNKNRSVGADRPIDFLLLLPYLYLGRSEIRVGLMGPASDYFYTRGQQLRGLTD